MRSSHRHLSVVVILLAALAVNARLQASEQLVKGSVWTGTFTSTDEDGKSNKYEVKNFRLTVIDSNAKDGKVTLKLQWHPNVTATFEGDINDKLERKGNLTDEEKAQLSQIKVADGTITANYKRGSGIRVGSFSVTRQLQASEQLVKGSVWTGTFTSTDEDGKSNKYEVKNFRLTVIDSNAKDGKVTLKLQWHPNVTATFEGDINDKLELKEILKGNPTDGEKAQLSQIKVADGTITANYKRASGSRVGSFSVTNK